MGIKIIKNTGNARRQMSQLTFEELTTSKPEKGLLVRRKESAGRNNTGRITTRHRGSGNAFKIRIVDCGRQDKLNIEGGVRTVEYDPGRKAFIMLIVYKDGEKRYHLAPEGIKVGDTVLMAKRTKAKIGNRMQLSNIPVGFDIYNVQINPNKEGQIAKTAGMAAKLVSLDGEMAQVQLPSGEVRFVHKYCYATVGKLSNADWQNVSIGKAGRNRWRRQRPEVRGKVMNPVDHPHGGGEGKNPIGMKYPKTPWGLHALGVKTRGRKKSSDRLIVRTRKGRALIQDNN
ncbi:50S ribosomal protein L2 [Candidatus Peregrinibacteria bacterium]|nr:50S ribosomal protein L2 [Candidatus Peregrinibacteria bacterium]